MLTSCEFSVPNGPKGTLSTRKRPSDTRAVWEVSISEGRHATDTRSTAWFAYLGLCDELEAQRSFRPLTRSDQGQRCGFV